MLTQYLGDNIDLINLASIDLGDLDLFEYQDSISDNYKEKTISEYLNYLTQGNQSSQIVFEFSRSLKKNLGSDLISRFNLKSFDLIDSLVDEILQRIKFKDMCMI